MDNRLNAQREVLLDATLGGDIELAIVDYYVRKQHPDAPRSQVQRETLRIIHDLAFDGLIVLGSMTKPDGRFEVWKGPLESSIERISKIYIDPADDNDGWWFAVWLRGTDKGSRMAQGILDERDGGTGS